MRKVPVFGLPVDPDEEDEVVPLLLVVVDDDEDVVVVPLLLLVVVPLLLDVDPDEDDADPDDDDDADEDALSGPPTGVSCVSDDKVSAPEIAVHAADVHAAHSATTTNAIRDTEPTFHTVASVDRPRLLAEFFSAYEILNTRAKIRSR
jgi:hypothetical protein